MRYENLLRCHRSFMFRRALQVSERCGFYRNDSGARAEKFRKLLRASAMRSPHFLSAAQLFALFSINAAYPSSINVNPIQCALDGFLPARVTCFSLVCVPTGFPTFIRLPVAAHLSQGVLLSDRAIPCVALFLTPHFLFGCAPMTKIRVEPLAISAC